MCGLACPPGDSGAVDTIAILVVICFLIGVAGPSRVILLAQRPEEFGEVVGE